MSINPFSSYGFCVYFIRGHVFFDNEIVWFRCFPGWLMKFVEICVAVRSGVYLFRRFFPFHNVYQFTIKCFEITQRLVFFSVRWEKVLGNGWMDLFCTVMDVNDCYCVEGNVGFWVLASFGKFVLNKWPDRNITFYLC